MIHGDFTPIDRDYTGYGPHEDDINDYAGVETDPTAEWTDAEYAEECARQEFNDRMLDAMLAGRGLYDADGWRCGYVDEAGNEYR